MAQEFRPDWQEGLDPSPFPNDHFCSHQLQMGVQHKTEAQVYVDRLFNLRQEQTELPTPDPYVDAFTFGKDEIQTLSYELSPERTVKMLEFRRRYSKCAAGYENIDDDEDDFEPLLETQNEHVIHLNYRSFKNTLGNVIGPQKISLLSNMEKPYNQSIAAINRGAMFRLSPERSVNPALLKNLIKDLKQIASLDPQNPSSILEFFQYKVLEFAGTNKELTGCLYHPSPVGLALQTACNKLGENMLKCLKEHHSQRVNSSHIFMSLLYMGIMRGSLTDIVKACQLLMDAGKQCREAKKVWVRKESEFGPDIFEEIDSMKDLYTVKLEEVGYSIVKVITKNPAFTQPSVRKVVLHPDDKKEQLEFIMKEASLKANDHERFIVFTKHDDGDYFLSEFLYKLEKAYDRKGLDSNIETLLRLCQTRQVKVLDREVVADRLKEYAEKGTLAVMREDSFILVNYNNEQGQRTNEATCTAFNRQTLQFDNEFSQKYTDLYKVQRNQQFQPMFGSFDEGYSHVMRSFRVAENEKEQTKRLFFPISPPDKKFKKLSMGIATLFYKVKENAENKGKIGMKCQFMKPNHEHHDNQSYFDLLMENKYGATTFYFDEGQLDLEGMSIILDKPDSFMDNNQSGQLLHISNSEDMKLIGLPPIFSLARLMQQDKVDRRYRQLLVEDPHTLETRHAMKSFQNSFDLDLNPKIYSSYESQPEQLSAFILQILAGSRLSLEKGGGICSQDTIPWEVMHVCQPLVISQTRETYKLLLAHAHSCFSKGSDLFWLQASFNAIDLLIRHLNHLFFECQDVLLTIFVDSQEMVVWLRSLDSFVTLMGEKLVEGANYLYSDERQWLHCKMIGLATIYTLLSSERVGHQEFHNEVYPLDFTMEMMKKKDARDMERLHLQLKFERLANRPAILFQQEHENILKEFLKTVSEKGEKWVQERQPGIGNLIKAILMHFDDKLTDKIETAPHLRKTKPLVRDLFKASFRKTLFKSIIQKDGTPNVSFICSKYLSLMFAQRLPQDFVKIMFETLSTRQTKGKALFTHDSSSFMVKFTGMLLQLEAIVMKMLGVPNVKVNNDNSDQEDNSDNESIKAKECPVEKSLRLINLSNDSLVPSIISSNLLQAGVEPIHLTRMIESSEKGLSCFQKIKEYEALSGAQLLKPQKLVVQPASKQKYQLKIQIGEAIFSDQEDVWGIDSKQTQLVVVNGPKRFESGVKSGREVNFGLEIEIEGADCDVITFEMNDIVKPDEQEEAKKTELQKDLEKSKARIAAAEKAKIKPQVKENKSEAFYDYSEMTLDQMIQQEEKVTKNKKPFVEETPQCKITIGQVRDTRTHLIQVSFNGQHFGTISLVTEKVEEVIKNIEEQEEKKVEEPPLEVVEYFEDFFPYGYDYGCEVVPEEEDKASQLSEGGGEVVEQELQDAEEKEVQLGEYMNESINVQNVCQLILRKGSDPLLDEFFEAMQSSIKNFNDKRKSTLQGEDGTTVMRATLAVMIKLSSMSAKLVELIMDYELEREEVIEEDPTQRINMLGQLLIELPEANKIREHYLNAVKMREWLQQVKSFIGTKFGKSNQDDIEREFNTVVRSVVEKAEFLVLLQPPGTYKTDEVGKPSPLLRDPSYFEGASVRQAKIEEQVKAETHDENEERTPIQAATFRREELQKDIAEAGTTSVLAILQSSVTVQEIKNELCLKVLMGSRRLTGLTILSKISDFMMGLYNDVQKGQIDLDGLQSDRAKQLNDFIVFHLENISCSLQKVLRTGDSNAKQYRCHYLDIVKGCGQYLELKSQDQLFKIIHVMVQVAKDQSQTYLSPLQSLVNAVDWNYMARDFTKLLEVDVFSALRSDLVDFIPTIVSTSAISESQQNSIQLQTKTNALKLLGTQKIILAMLARMTESNIERHETSNHQGHNSGNLPGLQRKISLVNKSTSNSLQRQSFDIMFRHFDTFVFFSVCLAQVAEGEDRVRVIDLGKENDEEMLQVIKRVMTNYKRDKSQIQLTTCTVRQTSNELQSIQRLLQFYRQTLEDNNIRQQLALLQIFTRAAPKADNLTLMIKDTYGSFHIQTLLKLLVQVTTPLKFQILGILSDLLDVGIDYEVFQTSLEEMTSVEFKYLPSHVSFSNKLAQFLFCLTLACKKKSWPSIYADYGQLPQKGGEEKWMYEVQQRLLQLVARTLGQQGDLANEELNSSLENCLNNGEELELDLLLQIFGSGFALPGVTDTLHKLDSYKTKVITENQEEAIFQVRRDSKWQLKLHKNSFKITQATFDAMSSLLMKQDGPDRMKAKITKLLMLQMSHLSDFDLGPLYSYLLASWKTSDSPQQIKYELEEITESQNFLVTLVSQYAPCILEQLCGFAEKHQKADVAAIEIEGEDLSEKKQEEQKQNENVDEIKEIVEKLQPEQKEESIQKRQTPGIKILFRRAKPPQKDMKHKLQAVKNFMIQTGTSLSEVIIHIMDKAEIDVFVKFMTTWFSLTEKNQSFKLAFEARCDFLGKTLIDLLEKSESLNFEGYEPSNLLSANEEQFDDLDYKYFSKKHFKHHACDQFTLQHREVREKRKDMKDYFFGVKLPTASNYCLQQFQRLVDKDLSFAHKLLFMQFKERLLHLLINKVPEVTQNNDLAALFNFNSDQAEKQRKTKLHLGAEFIWVLPSSMNIETSPKEFLRKAIFGRPDQQELMVEKMKQILVTAICQLRLQLNLACREKDTVRFDQNPVNIDIFKPSPSRQLHLIEDIIAFFTDPKMDLGYKVDSNFNYETWIQMKNQVLFAEYGKEKTTILATVVNVLLLYSEQHCENLAEMWEARYMLETCYRLFNFAQGNKMTLLANTVEPILRCPTIKQTEHPSLLTEQFETEEGTVNDFLRAQIAFKWVSLHARVSKEELPGFEKITKKNKFHQLFGQLYVQDEFEVKQDTVEFCASFMRLSFSAHKPFGDMVFVEPGLTQKLIWFVEKMKSMVTPCTFKESYYKLLAILDDNVDEDYFAALGKLFMIPAEEFSWTKVDEIMHLNPRSFAYLKEKFLPKEENPDLGAFHALTGLAAAIGAFNCCMLKDGNSFIEKMIKNKGSCYQDPVRYFSGRLAWDQHNIQSLQSWRQLRQLFDLRYVKVVEKHNETLKYQIYQEGYYEDECVTVDRYKGDRITSNQKRDRGYLGLTVYSQLMNECIQFCSTFMNFRVDPSNDRARCFDTHFKNEDAIDDGGVHRAVFETMADELHTASLPILLPTPNNIGGHGNDQECFIVGSQIARSNNNFRYSEAQLLEFFGAILAYSAISTHPLPLELHPTFWKLLLEEHLEADEQELFAIDAFSMQNLNKIRQWAEEKSAEEFEMLVESVETQFFVLKHTDQDGNEDVVELYPGSASRRVTRENVKEFIELSVEAELNKNSHQMNIIRKIVRRVAPEMLLTFNWRQLQERAEGNQVIDIDRLKRVTKWVVDDYDSEVCSSGSAKSDHSNDNTMTKKKNKVKKVRKEFWEDFQNVFTEDDRQSFLRFVTGKRRMNKGEFDFKFNFMADDSENENALPRSHTCYNTIDMPFYKDRQTRIDKVLVASHNCATIDDD